jgi:hypothetical protein
MDDELTTVSIIADYNLVPEIGALIGNRGHPRDWLAIGGGPPPTYGRGRQTQPEQKQDAIFAAEKRFHRNVKVIPAARPPPDLPGRRSSPECSSGSSTYEWRARRFEVGILGQNCISYAAG